ncbi:c-type cytochrome [Neptuniibacter sp. CAU 1671]|uniref:c-type cytochrome n=1 Tax=Neptuniibacter sp. CAU 1671 TaxID=3032593 RepID=UPI0023DCBF88|nr:c-type cytochrome [Neptuniibacter sp. CAU 1671]MDF2182520.1 c-type cytochrome [Neptuniibacter sp. CAU 1671]
MKKITSVLFALGLSIFLGTSAQAANDDAAVVERIKAVGSVCIEGDTSCGGAAPVAAASGGTRTGEEIYNGKCAGCHATGAAGAPKYGTSDWAERGSKGLGALLESAINGLNAMPPRGLCADCSDKELRNAIKYMVESAK